MKTIDEMQDEYEGKLAQAHIELDNYWLDRLKAEGIIFSKPLNAHWPYCSHEAVVGPHRVQFECEPRRRQGVYFYVQSATLPSNQYNGWRSCKVRSERGFERFMRRLSAPTFV